MNALYTGPTTADLACIPEDLTTRCQWVLWRGEDRIDKQTGKVKLTKVPYIGYDLVKASTTRSVTWWTFKDCMQRLPTALACWQYELGDAYRGGGIGFVFSENDPYAGIDLDNCRDPATGTIEAWAQTIIDALASYTEVSVSGTGVHIWVQGTVPKGRNKKGPIEMYDHGRFFTMTGWHLNGTPTLIHERQDALETLHTKVFGGAHTAPSTQKTQRAVPPLTHTDAELLNKAKEAGNGAKFERLFAGDSSGYATPSEADLALCDMLAFWTQDPAQLDRLFRQSDLMREKWDAKRGAQTYGAMTITKALAQPRAQYSGDLRQRRNGHPTAAADAHELPHEGQPPPADPARPSVASTDPKLPWSDYTNALALVREHGADLRYCFLWKAWLVWVVTHWEKDTSGTVMRLAKQTIKKLARQVEHLDEDAEIKALMAHIKSSLSTFKLRAMMESAQSELPLPVQPEDLDADAWLLNCQNGTFDLHTGTLRPHDRGDLLTKCLPIPYDANKTCPTWEQFLWRIMGGSQGDDNPDMSAGELENRRNADARAGRLITFLQRAIGYSLTGDTREQCLFLLHGSGSNGKSTFLETLQALLGDYAQSTPSASLLAKKEEDPIRNDLARFRGARLITAVEIGEGKRLNEELVKRLTGQDTVTARFLYAEFFDFQATHKLFIACNHLPQIRGQDHAIWRRIRRIPFTVTIPEDKQDKDLPAKLRAELPGILRWAVQGCLDWQRDGLGTPEEGRAATEEYKASMDVLGQFIAECCAELADARCKASDLYEAYKKWCTNGGVLPVNSLEFGHKLTERGFQPHKSNSINWRLGIGLPS